jgi:hypothetical protein
MARASRVFLVLTLALGLYLAVLLVGYFSTAHLPRFRVESVFMWFVAAGAAAVGLRPASDAGDLDVGDPLQRAGDLKWVFALFAAVAFVQYRSALGVGFLSDDFALADWAGRREWIHASATGFVRPIVPFVWSLLSAVPASLARSVHVTNVLLHAVNATLVVALAAGLGATRLEAVMAGLMFVTFPAMSEAVVWASGMQDVLMTTFALASILAVLDADLSSGAIIAAVGGTVVAILTKETAIVLPVLASLVAWASPRGAARRRVALFAMTVVAAGYALIRVAIGIPSGYGAGVSRYFAKQLIVDPFANLGAPWSAVWISLHPLISVTRALLIAALLLIAFATWRRGDTLRRAAVFSGWVLVAVLPVFSLFHVSATLEGSRYLYLPAAGFSLLLASLVRTGSARVPDRAATPLLVAVATVLVAPAIVSVPPEVDRWNEASHLRDQILVSYVRIMQPGSCGSIVTEGAADTLNGAYVLRNGFLQALADVGAEVDPAGPPTPRCRIIWTDHLIVRQE